MCRISISASLDGQRALQEWNEYWRMGGEGPDRTAKSSERDFQSRSAGASRIKPDACYSFSHFPLTDLLPAWKHLFPQWLVCPTSPHQLVAGERFSSMGSLAVLLEKQAGKSSRWKQSLRSDSLVKSPAVVDKEGGCSPRDGIRLRRFWQSAENIQSVSRVPLTLICRFVENRTKIQPRGSTYARFVA